MSPPLSECNQAQHLASMFRTVYEMKSNISSLLCCAELTNWPRHMSSGCGPGSTYIPSTRNMLHIVLGAQARGDVAEVQLFGDYLNLYGGSIAARRRAERGKRKEEEEREEEEEEV